MTVETGTTTIQTCIEDNDEHATRTQAPDKENDEHTPSMTTRTW
jgi:hypothetical protein